MATFPSSASGSSQTSPSLLAGVSVKDPAEHTEHAAANEVLQRGLNLVRSEFELRSWQVIWKSAVDQMSTADVAREFGVTANSVRQTKSRILRRLRQVLGEESWRFSRSRRLIRKKCCRACGILMVSDSACFEFTAR